MSIGLFKHLLPRAQVWRIMTGTQLREFFEGLVPSKDDFVEFMDLMWLDMFPAHTRELTAWEQSFGLFRLDLTEAERRERLDGLWKATGGQSPRYIQDTLQAAGFDVYVHEWWANILPDGMMEASGTTDWTAFNATLSKETVDPYEGLQWLKVVRTGSGARAQQVVFTASNSYRIEGWAKGDGTHAPAVYEGGVLLWAGTSSTLWQYFRVDFVATGTTLRLQGFGGGNGNYTGFDALKITPIPSPTARNPYTALGASLLGCGDPQMQCGEPLAQCGATSAYNGYMLVNKIYTTRSNLTCLCGEALMQCGEARAQCNENTGVIFERVNYPIPTDPNQWPYIYYVGGATFPDVANVPSSRRDEFEDLLLKISPAHLWIGMLIDYRGVIIEDETGYYVVEDETGFQLVEVL